MHYRTLKIDDKTYKYNVGKKFTKVIDENSNVTVYQNEEIGNKQFSPHGRSWPCSTCSVTPKNIRNAILGLGVPTKQCCHGTITNELVFSPYESEINGKKKPMINCDQCIENNEAMI
jgi:hypothetical protein